MSKLSETHEHREVVAVMPYTSNNSGSGSSQKQSAFDTDNEGVKRKYDVRFIMAMLAFSMAFISSQLIPLLFASLTYVIAGDLEAGSMTTWLFSAQLVACGATAPFVGSFSDIYGKKITALIGVGLAVLGMTVCASTPTAAGFIAGQALAGMSIAIQEMSAIAAISELVPVSRRGFFIAVLISGFIPFAPASLYGGLIAESSWRYNACLIAVWGVLTFVMIAVFYRSEARLTQRGLGIMDVFHRLDVVGGLLSITGICLLLVGLNWGGGVYQWKSPEVISTLTVGLGLCVLFGVWERFGARHPLFPASMIRAPRAFWLILLVILTAGINYVAILLFWPIQVTAVYGADLFHLGLYTLPYGTCILGGAIVSALLISVFSRHVQWVMLGFCIVQTIGTACMAAINPFSLSSAWAPLILGLFGAGGVLVPNQIIITAITTDEFISTATALGLSVRLVGQVIGYSVFYNRLIHVVTSKAFQVMAPVAFKTGILDVALIQKMILGVTAVPWSQYSKSVPQIVNTPGAYGLFGHALVVLWSESFKIVYYISIAFGVTACIACLMIGDLRVHMTNHVATHLR